MHRSNQSLRFAMSLAAVLAGLGAWTMTVHAQAPATPGQPTHQHTESDDHDVDDADGRQILTETDHDHVHDHGPASESSFGRLINWLGKLHPMAVHFPIALLIAAAVAELLGMFTGRLWFSEATVLMVWFATITAVSAALLGWIFGGFRWGDEDWLMTSHRWVGTVTAAWSLVVLALLVQGQRRKVAFSAYRAALFTGAALVGATGFLGGAMVWGLDHLAW
ncbi:hypothetical protein HED60_05725 [Planctomycetales bacterium ZRK34]|nr:hypothetical protein HED60_05725 [Planctomycetales bacterium ZRK34]